MASPSAHAFNLATCLANELGSLTNMTVIQCPKLKYSALIDACVALAYGSYYTGITSCHATDMWTRQPPGGIVNGPVTVYPRNPGD